MSAEATMVWAAKGAGATAGSMISLAYLLPRGRREAALRFAVGLTSGIVFGGAAGLWIAARLDLTGQIPEAELALIGSAAVSFAAWWALGALKRFAERASRDAGEALHREDRSWSDRHRRGRRPRDPHDVRRQASRPLNDEDRP